MCLIAATNRIEDLDPPLLRPGRFDRKVFVRLPDREARLEILRIHARNKPVADGLLCELAGRTAGMSGAELEGILNEAALLAARAGRAEIAREDLEESLMRIQSGVAGGRRTPSREELFRIALHEAGHAALATWFLGKVGRVSISQRGLFLGTTALEEDDRLLLSAGEARDRITVLLGGLAVEKEILGDGSLGAEDDARRARELAARLSRAGLGERIGAGDKELEAMAPQILDECIERALGAVQENREGIMRLRDLLLEQESCDGETAMRVLGASV